MEEYRSEKTEDTPEIHLNAEKGIFKIHGKSLPEDAAEFYYPVYEWFRNYVDDPAQETILDVHMEYINSSSVKRVFAILCLLEEIEPYHNTVLVKWKYEKGDDLMKEKGEEFDDYLEVPFEIVELN
ncbi:MAG: DUF1987 domain-containing protein [Flavobacteriales bacterium]|jgi:hypothetical protein|nr:DUF1987 domain-containing protein [Flavobacteriales bacterium]